MQGIILNKKVLKIILEEMKSLQGIELKLHRRRRDLYRVLPAICLILNGDVVVLPF